MLHQGIFKGSFQQPKYRIQDIFKGFIIMCVDFLNHPYEHGLIKVPPFILWAKYQQTRRCVGFMTSLSHKWPQNLWRASPLTTRALASSPRLSSSLAASSASTARSWHQDPVLWVQGPCQLGTRCFKAPTHSVRGPRHCKVGLGGINDIPWGHYKSMLASMTISSTVHMDFDVALLSILAVRLGW